MVRDTDVWEFAIFDLEFARRGASELRYVLHYDEAGDADGFATYRFKEKWDEEPEGEVRIQELWAEDAGAHAGLWRYLLDLDLARTFTFWSAALDEPLRHLVADARAVGHRASPTTSTCGWSTSRRRSLPGSTPPASTWSSRSTTRSSPRTAAATGS